MTIEQALQIARNDDFRNRVKYLMIKAVIAILNGAEPSAADILLGQRILDGGEPLDIWTTAVLTNSTIMAGAHAVDGKTIQDSDMEFLIAAQWPAFAK